MSAPWFARPAEVTEYDKPEFPISTLSVSETIRQPTFYSMLLTSIPASRKADSILRFASGNPWPCFSAKSALQLANRCFHKRLTKSVLYRTIFVILSCLGSSKHSSVRRVDRYGSLPGCAFSWPGTAGPGVRVMPAQYGKLCAKTNKSEIDASALPIGC